MSTAFTTAEKLYTVAEWLELEKSAELRHEFYYGKLFSLSGGSKPTNKIIGDLTRILDQPLYEKAFQIFVHNVKAEVVPNGIYRYPDLVVAPIADDEDNYIVKHPVLLVEVASESSSQRDRIKKRREYLEVPFLWYYLIINQDEMLAELHTRDNDGRWAQHYFTEPEEVIDLQRFELNFPLSAVYARWKEPSKN